MPDPAPAPPPVLPSDYNFRGRVTDRLTGAGIPNVKVLVYRDGVVLCGARTKPRGYFRLRVPEGPLEVVVEADDSATSSAIRTALQVAPNRQVLREFTLEGRLTLQGTVTDEQGRPLAAVPVHLVKGNWTTAQTRTDASGAFRFAGLSAMPDYEALALPPGRPPGRAGPLTLTAAQPPVTISCPAPAAAAGASALQQVLAEAAATWQFRALIWQLVLRNLRVRYQGSALGLLWTLADPLLRMIVLTLVFKVFMDIAIPNYSVFLLVGLVAWQFLSGGLAGGCQCFIQESGAVTNTAFPLAVLPAAVALDNLVHFGLSLFIVFGWLTLVPLAFSLAEGTAFAPAFVRAELLWLPALILLLTLLVGGLAFLFSWVNTLYKDVSHIINVVLQLGFFASPILYTSASAMGRLDRLRDGLGTLFLLNPMAVLIEAYRAVIFGPSAETGVMPAAGFFWYVLGLALLLVTAGFWTLARRQTLLRERL